MTLVPQNWQQRLAASGKSVNDRNAIVSEALANNTSNSNVISVDAVANAVDSTATSIKGATEKLSDSINQVGQNFLSSATNQIGNFAGSLLGSAKLDNELDQFASYNYIFTLGVLTPFEVNYPDSTYRQREPNIVVLRSGGGDTPGSKTVFEQGGKTEYFIENVVIDTIIAPTDKTKLTNATAINFDVLEPYSMGQFLSALQVAALVGGYKNYIDAIYFLQIQFKGYDDFGRPLTASRSRKIYPLRFYNIEFDVNEGGSRYNVQAIPSNEIALTDENQSSHTDAQLLGKTVGEILQSGGQSLTTILNNRELQKLDAKQINVADQYIITFPKVAASTGAGDFSSISNNSGATTLSSKDPSSSGMGELSREDLPRLFASISGIQNGQIPENFEEEIQKVPGIVVERSQLGEQIRSFADNDANWNEIGSSPIIRSNLDSGKMPMADPAFSEVENRPGEFDKSKIQRSQDVRAMIFSSGKRIQDMIEQVVISSEYGRQIINAQPDENGMVPWFRIDTQVYIVTGSEQEDRVGELAKVYVYRVMPYKVHRSNFQPPTQNSPGIENLKKQAAKEYNYIYTGLNKDIIDFDIKYNLAFYTGVQGDYGQTTSDSVRGGSQEIVGGNNRTTTGQPEGNTETLPQGRQKNSVPTPNSQDGGGIMLHPENIVGFDFNRALINSPGDLIQVDLKIHGDPYYLADSGIGNYSSNSNSGSININSDGSISYENSEVDILLNFRTPIDYNANGLMDFPGLGYLPVKQFSGVYKVILVKNEFKEGQFTQTLEMIRRRAQDQDSATNAVSENTGAIETTTSEKQITETPEAEKTGSDGSSQGGTGGQASQGIVSTTDNVTRVDVRSVQRSARNQAISDALARGASTSEAEAAGQRAGNLAGAEALRNVQF